MKNVSNSKRLVQVFGLILLLILNSCATTPKLNQPKTSKQSLLSKTKPVQYSKKPISEKEIRRKLERLNRALKKGKLNKQDWRLHDELLDHYIELKKQRSNKIKVPANSRVIVPLETYCLDSGKASPSQNEVYHWQKSTPAIKYYSDLLALRRSGQITQNDLQELIWNLENQTRWDDYPNKLKAILQKVDPKAALKLPSNLKDQATSLVTDYVTGLPGASEALDAYNLVKGKYYSYKDFRNSVESLTSKHKLSAHNSLTKIPGTNLYSQSKSNSFDDQQITFYNPTNKDQEINLNEYYLAPERKDVQRIGVNQSAAKDPTLLTDLEKSLYKTMARLGIGFTPVFNDIADLYELLTGKDFVSGEQLSPADRMLSGVGVIAGSGAAYRYAKRAINSPASYIDDFSKGLGKASQRSTSLTPGSLIGARTSTAEASNQTQSVKSNYSNLRKSLDLLKRNEISRDDRRKIVKAFTKNSAPKKLNQDTKVYRYSADGKTSKKGSWVTKQKVKDPYNNLALPNPGPYKINEWTAPKGTEVIEGLVAPNFGRPGGAHQIFVPNPKVLK